MRDEKLVGIPNRQLCRLFRLVMAGAFSFDGVWHMPAAAK